MKRKLSIEKLKQAKKTGANLAPVDLERIHPAPTDLLLTDEEIEACFDEPLTLSPLWDSEIKKLLKAQIAKLQQARPTEQAREKLAGMIMDFANKTQRGEFIGSFEFADQILQLLPFPDEQGIRSDERKKIKLGLIAMFSRTPINLWPVESEKLIKSFGNPPLQSGKAPGESPLSKGQER